MSDASRKLLKEAGMKSSLQERAEAAAGRFRTEARRPIVIEFAGVPKAGKTSTIAQIQTFLKRCGFRVKVVVERASVCPIVDKRHATFNVWTACTTLAQILENTQEPPRPDDPHVLILDRGIFDAITWFTLMDRLSRIRTEDRKVIENFLLLPEWKKRLTGVIVMLVSPEEAMKREQGVLPIEGIGSIMNRDVLARVRETTERCVKDFAGQFRIVTIDTTPSRQKQRFEKTVTEAVDTILAWIEEHLQEDILCLPKDEVAKLFAGQTTVTGQNARALYSRFLELQRFEPRTNAEEDLTLVQALPVVVVRNRSGDVLRLKRREKHPDNPLHEKTVIWAGGHVRKEDGSNGDAILQCALRELREELRLSVETSELAFIGAVYVNAGKRTGRHVALVFQWQAESDDVAVTLSTSEFFERRGTSLSGTFVPLQTLIADAGSAGVEEPWSSEIVARLLGASLTDGGRLF